jgi:hypothetical protein
MTSVARTHETGGVAHVAAHFVVDSDKAAHDNGHGLCACMSFSVWVARGRECLLTCGCHRARVVIKGAEYVWLS